jgi:hypothetical protein
MRLTKHGPVAVIARWLRRRRGKTAHGTSNVWGGGTWNTGTWADSPKEGDRQ